MTNILKKKKKKRASNALCEAQGISQDPMLPL